MKKFVFPENKSVIDFRVMEDDAIEPGPGGAGAPPSCFGAAAAATGTGIFGAADDALRRILRFFLDIYRNNSNDTNTSNTIITIDYLSLSIILTVPETRFSVFAFPDVRPS